MDSSLTTIIAIFLAALLMFIFPVSMIADFNDDTSQMYVKTTLDNFVNTVTAKGTLNKEDYEKLEAALEATNNSYDIEITINIADVNPGKKDNKGDMIYYSVYTKQIMEVLNNDNNNIYYLKKGDFIKVAVKNRNTTISQMLKNVLYGITGNENYVISASASGVVVTTGH